MNSKTKMRYTSQKGITLIALVITIIVLLILAGVTISMVLGDDGIIAQAQKAKEDTEKAQEDEEEALKAYESAVYGLELKLGALEGTGYNETIEIGAKRTLILDSYYGETGEVTWASSDENIATVSNGVVTAKAIGDVKIKATINGKSVEKTIYVREFGTFSFDTGWEVLSFKFVEGMTWYEWVTSDLCEDPSVWYVTEEYIWFFRHWDDGTFTEVPVTLWDESVDNYTLIYRWR